MEINFANAGSELKIYIIWDQRDGVINAYAFY